VSDDLILASNEDRARAVSRLQQAQVEGRLTVEELASRVEAAQHARTVGDLESVLTGLPRAPAVHAAYSPIAAAEGYGAGAMLAVALVTLLVPFADLVGLVVALAKLQDERVPARRSQLRLWAMGSGALVLLKVLVLLLVVAH